MQRDAFLVFDTKAPVKQAITTGASGATISPGKYKKIAISAVDSSFDAASFHVKFGDSTIGIAAVTDMGFPPGGPYIIQLGNYDSIRIFNPEAGTVNFYIAQLMNA